MSADTHTPADALGRYRFAVQDIIVYEAWWQTGAPINGYIFGQAWAEPLPPAPELRITPATMRHRVDCDQKADPGLVLDERDMNSLYDLDEMRAPALVAGFKLGVSPLTMGRLLDRINNRCWSLMMGRGRGRGDKEAQADVYESLLFRLQLALDPLQDVLLCARSQARESFASMVPFLEKDASKPESEATNPTEYQILRELAKGPLPGRQLAARCGVEYESYFRSRCSKLIKQGRIRRGPKGYELKRDR